MTAYAPTLRRIQARRRPIDPWSRMRRESAEAAAARFAADLASARVIARTSRGVALSDALRAAAIAEDGLAAAAHTLYHTGLSKPQVAAELDVSPSRARKLIDKGNQING
ncbi:hypothetical protein KIH27_16050 [Mycobacterium sp. M1]|uniref:Uncharacterized protein n=1 Tax=Mycolicibacter acidiphilus TaxID=2835306 RepID=A0ABS5RNP1_9MYCO|nr:hypothetical protein [Mycolicibacter acidiphilus]MBS9535101.1 hypothetical protein [Mycolicibacter acidiphilus]